MARLRGLTVEDSEDELPELCDLLGFHNIEDASTKPTPQAKTDRRAQSSSTASKAVVVVQDKSSSRTPSDLLMQTRSPLKSIAANAVQLPFQNGGALCERKASAEIPLAYSKRPDVRSSPARSVKKIVSYRVPSSGLTDVENSDSDDSFTDLSGFIVSDADDAPGIIPTLKTPRRLQRGLKRRPISTEDLSKARSVSPEIEVVNLVSPSPKRYVSDSQKSSDDSFSDTEIRESSHSVGFDDSNEGPETLKYSPVIYKSPRKLQPGISPATPPASPSKTKLQSPTKRNRIPLTPHRPSIDAYWSQEVINSWNDTHSPVKTPKTLRKNRVIPSDDNESDSPIPFSPSKSTVSSKQSRAQFAAQKVFDKEKRDLASAFLSQIDTALTQNRVSALAASTGGIKILWSKRLNTTAGRANWRRETVRCAPLPRPSCPSTSPCPDSPGKATTHHHATIELATKVISSAPQLLNVLAHEYCHLCVFMVDGVKDRPHGKEFKTWAAKATRMFKDRGVEVTTKHSFEIKYKYAWECGEKEGCGVIYERHSKSIDVGKMGCGRCRGRLVQVRPVPRGGVQSRGGEAGEGELGEEGAKPIGKKRTEYQEFVKREYERVKKERPGIGFGEIMRVLGEEYRESKKAAAKKASKADEATGDELERALDRLKIDVQT